MCGQFGDNYGANYDVSTTITTVITAGAGGGSRDYVPFRGPRLTFPGQYERFATEITGALPISLPVLLQKSEKLGLFTAAKGALWSRMSVLRASASSVTLPTAKAGSVSAKLYSALDASVHLQMSSIVRANRRAYIPLQGRADRIKKILECIEEAL